MKRVLSSIHSIAGTSSSALKTTAATLALTGIAALGLSACASVKLAPSQQTSTVSTASQSGHSERQALVSATRELERTPWPEIAETSLTQRMASVLFGGDDKSDGLSRDEALDIYVSSLIASSANPGAALVSDADHTLRIARTVAESGRLAAVAINPDTDDIAVLEDAMSDVRLCREMYAAAAKRLASEGYEVPERQVDQIKAAFSQAITDISSTADLVADRAMDIHQASALADDNNAVE